MRGLVEIMDGQPSSGELAGKGANPAQHFVMLL